VRVAVVGGVLVLTVGAGLLVLPAALGVFAGFGALGAPWGLGRDLVVFSLAISAALGLLLATLTFVWTLARADRLALELARAWPLPGTRPDAPAPPRLPDGAHHRLRNLLDGLAIAAGLPRAPRAAVVIDDAPNCLTVGRRPDHAWIVVTTGLMDLLPRAELEAVLAYELGRVAELDVGLDTVVYACTARTTELWGGAFDDLDELSIVLAPFALLAAPAVLGGYLLRAVALRGRARLADGLAVRYCRNPVALAHALRRIADDPRTVRRASAANAHLWLEYPHTRASRWLLRTHRMLPARVERIESLARLAP